MHCDLCRRIAGVIRTADSKILEEKLRKATGVSIPSWRTSPSSGQTPEPDSELNL
jgi:hypothetical protein